MKILNHQETLQLLDFPGLIDSAELAYKSHSSSNSAPSHYINMAIGKDFAHYKAGYRIGSDHFVVKYSGGFWTYTKPDDDLDLGYLIVHSARTGEPLIMFLDKGLITDYRTAAAGAFTSKLLARENIKRVGVIGTGVQAHLQIEALSHVRNFEEVKVWGRNPDNVRKYVKDMSLKLPKVKFIGVDSTEQAVRGVDILITTTYADKPVVKSDWIEKGMHIVAVGACGPEMQEHEPETLKLADKLYVDSIEKASVDGELHHGLECGLVKKEHVTGEVGDVILGKVPGRESDDEITFVDLVGIGIQDATAAEYLMGKIGLG